MSKNTIKVSFNMSKELMDYLRKTADKEGTTITEVLRKHLSTAKYIEDVQANDERVFIGKDTDDLKEVVFR